MANEKNKKETKVEEKKNWVNPILAWTILGVELCIVLLIGFLVCRV